MGGDLEGSDEVLWRLVVNGDGDAFGALFDRHRDRVLRHALKVVGSAHVAEDVTAMVFYEAWRRREYVRMVNDSIVAWLLETANNTIRNDLRQRRRYRNFLNQLPRRLTALTLPRSSPTQTSRTSRPRRYSRPSHDCAL